MLQKKKQKLLPLNLAATASASWVYSREFGGFKIFFEKKKWG